MRSTPADNRSVSRKPKASNSPADPSSGDFPTLEPQPYIRQTDPLRVLLAHSTTEDNIDTMARDVCELAKASTSACWAMLSVRDNASPDLLVLYPSDTASELKTRQKIELLDGSPAQLATSVSTTMTGDRASLEPGFAEVAPLQASVFVHTPMTCGGRSNGLLTVGFEHAQTAEGSIETLQELASLASPWFGYHITLQLTRSRISNAEAALGGIARLGPVATQEEARQAIVTAGCRMLGTDMIALFTIDPCVAEVEYSSSEPVDDALASAFWELFGQNATSRNDEGVWVIREVVKEARHNERATKIFSERGISSILACPVHSNAGATGVLVVFHRCRLVDTDDQATLISTVGALATSVISYAYAVEQSTCLLDDLAGANQELSVQAAQDGLTNLPNHRAFQQGLAEMCRRSTATRRPFSLVMIDVDHFKLYNDSYGHQEGDAALRDVAGVISSGLRHEDMAARYGGEEFAIAFAGIGRDNARQVSERIRRAVAEHPFASGRLTISIGVAEFPADGSSPSEIIEHADRALYHAKSTGRNKVVTWGSAETHNEEAWASSLRPAHSMLVIEPRHVDPSTRIEGILDKAAFDTQFVEDADAAVEALKARVFHVALVCRTSADAIGDLSKMAAIHPCMPIVLLTDSAYTTPDLRALPMGASDVITRPRTPAELSVVVDRILERVRMEKQRLTQTRASVQDQAIEALMAAVAAKDPITAMHSEGVASLSLAIADRLGLPDSERRALEVAARLHDVGKLSLPDKCLNKITPLTDDEWRAVREHPVTGSRIVGAITELSYVSNIVRHHHERLDGSGYPDGLSDAAIPYLAKLIAVVDAYQAMTSDRAYRRAMSPAQAIAELQRHSGVHYDPHIVETLTNHLASTEESDILGQAA